MQPNFVPSLQSFAPPLTGSSLREDADKSLSNYISKGFQAGQLFLGQENPIAKALATLGGMPKARVDSFMQRKQQTPVQTANPDTSLQGGLVQGQIGRFLPFSSQGNAVTGQDQAQVGATSGGQQVRPDTFEQNPFLHYLATNFGPHAIARPTPQPQNVAQLPIQNRARSVIANVANPYNTTIPNRNAIPANASGLRLQPNPPGGFQT